MPLYIYANDEFQIICPAIADNVTQACDMVRKRTGLNTVKADDLYLILHDRDLTPLIARIQRILLRRVTVH